MNQPQASFRRPHLNLPRGRIYGARILTSPPAFARARGSTRGRLGLGLRYEELVHREFLQRYSGYLYSLWLEFEDSEGIKYCQPDGIIVNPWQGLLVAVEVKYSHTDEAYTQLFRLYVPVLRAIFGGTYEVSGVEVCKWFDRAVLTTKPVQLCKYPEIARPGEFHVHIWRP